MVHIYTDENGVLQFVGDPSDLVPPTTVRRSDWKPGPEITAAVVRIGEGGRGFIVEGDFAPRIITAAHCLPELPPAHGASYPEERHYGCFLSKLGAEPSISVECLFVDPVSDLAVLGEPSEQLPDQQEAYEALVESVTPLSIDAVEGAVQAWLLSLDGVWFPCIVQHSGPALWIRDVAQPIKSGMSGSPIMVDGKAVGVVCISAVNPDHAPHGPNPALAQCLPAWLAQKPNRRDRA